MIKYYGIGHDNTVPNKLTISIFMGLWYFTIAFYTKKYGFRPRFYLYRKEEFEYSQNINLLNLTWFIGFQKT